MLGIIKSFHVIFAIKETKVINKSFTINNDFRRFEKLLIIIDNVILFKMKKVKNDNIDSLVVALFLKDGK